MEIKFNSALMIFILAFFLGLLVYAAIRSLATGFYTVRPDERAVLTSFGRAQRLTETATSDAELTEEERERYDYPAVRVILKWSRAGCRFNY